VVASVSIPEPVRAAEEPVQQVPVVQPAVTAEIDNSVEYYQKLALRDQLKKQQSEIAENKAACAKAKKGWIAGTVIGSAGVVGTAVGIGVQAKQTKDKKETISTQKTTISGLDENISTLDASIRAEK
jgi:hypothetical protein